MRAAEARTPRPPAFVDSIKALIASGEFEMGAKLTENQLAKRFGVSKAPVRQALGYLAADGLIEIRPRAGTYVFKPDEQEIEQINAVRAVLECAAIRTAMRADPAGLLDALRSNVTEAEKLDIHDNHRRAYRQLDSEFHWTFFRYARNPFLSKAYEVVAVKIWAMRASLTFPHAHVQMSLGYHKRIVEMLSRSEVDEACLQLEQHIFGSFTQREKTLLCTTDID